MCKIIFTIYFCVSLIQLTIGQESLDYSAYNVNGVEIRSPYQMRSMDFKPNLPEEWDLSLHNSESKGFISNSAIYGVLFVADYDGQLPYDIEEFGDKLIEEVRRRLNLKIDYMTSSRYSRAGMYGMKYTAEGLFRDRKKKLDAILIADKEKIVVFAGLYNPGESEVKERMNRISRSIRSLR